MIVLLVAQPQLTRGDKLSVFTPGDAFSGRGPGSGRRRFSETGHNRPEKTPAGSKNPEYKIELGVTVQPAFASDLHQAWTNLKSMDATGVPPVRTYRDSGCLTAGFGDQDLQ